MSTTAMESIGIFRFRTFFRNTALSFLEFGIPYHRAIAPVSVERAVRFSLFPKHLLNNFTCIYEHVQRVFVRGGEEDQDSIRLG